MTLEGSIENQNTQASDSDLTAVANLATNGLVTRTGTGTMVTRSVAVGSTKISVSNSDGVAGNPTLDAVEANFTLDNIGGTLAVTKGGTGAATAAGARTNLGLGSIATQDASGVAITGGSITGITDLAVADGGTGASTASGARTNLVAAASGANTDITSIYLDNTGLKLKDTNASHGLIIAPGTDLTADRTLTITTGDAARTLDISSGSVTITAAAASILDDASLNAIKATLNTAAFSAIVGTTITNVTGTGTEYTVIFDSEEYDVGSNYNNTTGVFTAPTTGMYSFSFAVSVLGMLAASSSSYYFHQTGSATIDYYGTFTTTSATTLGVSVVNGAHIIKLISGDALSVKFLVSGEASDIVDVQATNSKFAGVLIG